MSLLLLNITFVSKEQLLFLHSMFFLSSYRDMNTSIVASIGSELLLNSMTAPGNLFNNVWNGKILFCI